MIRLVRFARVSLAAGEEAVVYFTLDDRSFTLFSKEGREIFVHGTYHVYAGGSLHTGRSEAPGALPCVQGKLTV